MHWFLLTAVYMTGLSKCFKCTSASLNSLFTDDIFLLKFEHFHDYRTPNSLKSGGTKDHFRRVNVPGTALTERPVTVYLK